MKMTHLVVDLCFNEVGKSTCDTQSGRRSFDHEKNIIKRTRLNVDLV